VVQPLNRASVLQGHAGLLSARTERGVGTLAGRGPGASGKVNGNDHPLEESGHPRPSGSARGQAISRKVATFEAENACPPHPCSPETRGRGHPADADPAPVLIGARHPRFSELRVSERKSAKPNHACDFPFAKMPKRTREPILQDGETAKRIAETILADAEIRKRIAKTTLAGDTLPKRIPETILADAKVASRIPKVALSGGPRRLGAPFWPEPRRARPESNRRHSPSALSRRISRQFRRSSRCGGSWRGEPDPWVALRSDNQPTLLKMTFGCGSPVKSVRRKMAGRGNGASTQTCSSSSSSRTVNSPCR